MQTLRSTFLLVAAAALATAGCTGGDSNDLNHATIRGQVTDEQPSSFAPMANASVQAYVSVEGELHAVSDTVETDAQGRYELTVEFSSDSITNVIVEATNDASFEARALVSATIEAGSEHTAPPMNNETRVEADVYVSASVDTGWAAEMSNGLRALVTAEVAAAISASVNYASDVDACADAMIAALQARAESTTDAQLEAIVEAEAEAQADLDAALDAATDTSAVEAAIEAYSQAMMQAYADAGMTLADVSQMVQAEVHAAISASVNASVEVREELREQLEAMRAEIVAQVNAAYFQALGAAAQLQSDLDEARVTLEAAIEASAGVESQINDAWVAYNAYVEGELRTQLGVVQAGADTALDTVIATVATAETTLETALTTAGNDVAAICAAYGSFTASVEAAVSGDATIGSMAAAHVEATAAILVNSRLE